MIDVALVTNMICGQCIQYAYLINSAFIYILRSVVYPFRWSVCL